MGRRHRAKLGVMPDRSRYQPLTQQANRAKVSKSRMALLAKEGYHKMAHEDVLDAEAYLSAMSEICSNWSLASNFALIKVKSLALSPRG